jgi:hypothetical protein
LSYFENNGVQRPQSYYYESSKKSQIPFIFMWKNKKKFIAAQVSDSETVSRKEIGNFDSFKKKITNDVSDGRYLLLYGKHSYLCIVTYKIINFYLKY